MKIFDWVHHKFYPKDGLFSHHHCAKKDEVMINNINENNADCRKALLENVLFGDENDALEAAGILAIGTFGAMMIDSVIQDEITEEEEEEYKVVVEQDKHEYYYYNNSNNNEEYDEVDGGGITTLYDGEDEEEENPLITCHGEDDEEDENSKNQMAMMMSNSSSAKRERITLADLFSADTSATTAAVSSGSRSNSSCSNDGLRDIIVIRQSQNKSYNSNNKAEAIPISSPILSKESLARKLIHKPRPINKLHQLMTRMLKRKIHPEMESKKTQTNSTSLTTK